MKAREELTRLLTSMRQYEDSTYSGNDTTKLKNREDARNNLAYSMQMFGGVKDDSSITVMGLGKKSILVAPHMKVVNKYTKGILGDDSKLEITLPGDGYSIKIVDPTNPARSFSQRTMRGGMSQNEAKTETDMIVSRSALEEFAVVNETTPEETKDTEESLMIAYLRGQAKLLETLLAT